MFVATLGILFVKDASDLSSPTLFYDNLEKVCLDGDLIFRKGKGLFSDYFRSFGAEKSEYSHVGIITKEKDKLFVIHAEANELTGIGAVQKISLEDFISRHNASLGAVYRVDTANFLQKKLAVRVAMRYFELKIPFDSDFNLATEDRLYCTELVWRAYKTSGIDLAPRKDIFHIPLNSKYRNKQFISVSSLINGGKINIVKALR